MSKALKAFSAMRSIGIGASSVQFRVRAPDWQHRSRASAQVGFISSLCPGQHRRLRPQRKVTGLVDLWIVAGDGQRIVVGGYGLTGR